jgi:hypothetical protein
MKEDVKKKASPRPSRRCRSGDLEPAVGRPVLDKQTILVE